MRTIFGLTDEIPATTQKVWRSIGGGTVDIAGKGELAEQPKLDDAFLVQDESASEQKQVLYKNMGVHRIAVNGHLSRPTDDEVVLDIPAISHGKLYRPIKDPLPGHGAAYTWAAVAVTADGTAGFKGVFLRADVINFTPVHGDWCLFGSAQLGSSFSEYNTTGTTGWYSGFFPTSIHQWLGYRDSQADAESHVTSFNSSDPTAAAWGAALYTLTAYTPPLADNSINRWKPSSGYGVEQVLVDGQIAVFSDEQAATVTPYATDGDLELTRGHWYGR